jgi:hypothetical protein
MLPLLLGLALGGGGAGRFVDMGDTLTFSCTLSESLILDAVESSTTLWCICDDVVVVEKLDADVVELGVEVADCGDEREDDVGGSGARRKGNVVGRFMIRKSLDDDASDEELIEALFSNRSLISRIFWLLSPALHFVPLSGVRCVSDDS